VVSNKHELGWVVEYLVDVRHGKLSEVGYTPAGLYGGIFLGRLLLAEPTHRFGERRMILLYSVIMLALQLVFWLVPNIIASATALSLLGFFFGPLFPIVSHLYSLNSAACQPFGIGCFGRHETISQLSEGFGTR